MVNIKNTLDELKDILNTIKAKQDANTAWTGTEKADIEKRLNHILNKSNPRHTNLTADLDIDLAGIENINKLIGDEKLKTDAEIKKLTDEKNQLQTDLSAKEALIKQKDEEIGGKITKDLMDKLEKVSKLDFKKQPKKNADGTDTKDKDGNIIYEEVVDLEPLKTLLQEIKTKGAKVDVSSLDSKFKEVKDEVGKLGGGEKGINYWNIGACIGAGLAAICGIYAAFFKKNEVNVYEGTKKEEIDIS